MIVLLCDPLPGPVVSTTPHLQSWLRHGYLFIGFFHFFILCSFSNSLSGCQLYKNTPDLRKLKRCLPITTACHRFLDILTLPSLLKTNSAKLTSYNKWNTSATTSVYFLLFPSFLLSLLSFPFFTALAHIYISAGR